MNPPSSPVIILELYGAKVVIMLRKKKKLTGLSYFARFMDVKQRRKTKQNNKQNHHSRNEVEISLGIPFNMNFLQLSFYQEVQPISSMCSYKK